MAITLPVPFAHMWGEMYKGIDEQGPYYEVLYYITNWSDSDLVINALKGITSSVSGKITRGLPHQHPLSPNLYCQTARAEGLGGPVLNANGLPNYDGGCKIRATYRASVLEGVLQFGDDPNNFQQIDPTTPLLWCTQELDFSGETVVVPNTSFTWASDGKLASVPLKVKVGITQMRLTFHRVPAMPMATMRAFRGKVNNATFLGADPYKVLFEGGSTVRDVQADGTVLQRVTLVLSERDQPWWNTLRPDKMKWDALVDGDGAKAYTATDLSPLLTPFFSG